MDTREHWERVYRTKKPTEVSWYAVHLGTSLNVEAWYARLRARSSAQEVLSLPVT